MADQTDFAAIMGAVANELLPEFMPFNKGMSTTKEQRWGKKGGFSVRLDDGTWYDHEDQEGGGVIALLARYKGFEKQEAVEWLVERGLIERKKEEPKEKFAGFMDRHPVAIFDYHDDRGRLAYQVLKFPKDSDGPRYMQRRPHPAGGWIWGLRAERYGKNRAGDWFKAKKDKHYAEEADFEETRWWLFHRDEVLKAKAEGKPVVLVEGEKDVETLRAWGFVATTNQGGAKNWKPELDEDLAGVDVVICSDLDDAGSTRTALRGAALRGIAKSVRVIDLSLHWKDHPEKADVSDWKEKGGGTAAKFDAILRKAPLWTPQPPKSRFGGFTFSQLDQQSVSLDYLIDSWFTERGRSVVGGPSGSGKTFFTLHAAMCVARGQDFFAYPVKRGGVIYQAGEGGQGIRKRFAAYKKHHNVDDDEDIPLVVLPAKVDLFSKEGDTKALIDEIKAWALTMSEPLRLVVIDTLATATIGADENSGKDMSFVLSNIAQIEEECRCHVMLVHHMNADGKKLRGHTSIHANVDQVVLITQDEDTKLRSAKLVKQKDDEDGLRIPFALMAVPVGMNAKTEREITSCVVLSVSEKERLKKEQERLGFSVSPMERQILERLFEAQRKYGKFVASAKDGPASAIGKIVVDFSHYLDVCVDRMVEVENRENARDAARKAFTRHSRFITGKVIETDRPYLWWNGRPIRGFPQTFPKKDQGDLLNDQSPPSPGMQEVYEMQDRGDEVLF